MNKPESARIITILFLMAILIFPFFVLASTTDGTIDSTYKYAWGENAGWINFGTSGGNVHIMDSALTGYAWSENYGWINLSPANGGVLNDGNGDLSGNAWGENLGWINFASVSINSSGNFSGTAVISNDSSLISFNCAGCSVKTDWRPASARIVLTSSSIVPSVVPPIVPLTVPPIVPPVVPSIVSPAVPPIIPSVSPQTSSPDSSSASSSSSAQGSITSVVSKLQENISLFANKTIETVKASSVVVRKIVEKPIVKTFEGVAVVVPTVFSLLALINSIEAGVPIFSHIFYPSVIALQFLGFRRKPKPWGTVYDSRTKRPIPFARVEILNEQSRKLQSTIADANGRYGFLVSDKMPNIQLRAYFAKYDFPSKQEPSIIEQKLYPNIYKGGFINSLNTSMNSDLPMDPRDKTITPSFYFGITSIKLNNILTKTANVFFIAGVILGIMNIVINPSVISFIIFAIILITFLFRVSGFKLKQFGLTKDKETNKVLPFGLIALHNQGGERVNFTVSDDSGRYFLLTPKGNYSLKAYTPSHILPTRTKEISISTKKGWISKEIEI